MGLKNAFDRLFGLNNKNKTEQLVEEINNEIDTVEEQQTDLEAATQELYGQSEETVEEYSEQTDEVAEQVEEAAAEAVEEAVEPLAVEQTNSEEQDFVEEIVEEAEEAKEEAETIEQTVVAENEPSAQQEIEQEIIDDAAQQADESVDEQKTKDTTVPKKGFFAKLISGLEKTRKSFNDKIDNVLKMFKSVDEEMFEELEEALIMADVGVDTSLYIIEQLRSRVSEKKIKEPADVKQEIEEIISEILAQNDTTLRLDTTPSVIMIIGVNGVGKTTSIGKLAAKYKAEGKKVVLGAADTFRAAAIDQLQIWADRSGVDLVKHQEGSDPAAVVFDTITAAKSRNADVIILDTAGRLHNKKNLMDELNKIYRVMERELPGCAKETLLVVDATTGQNAVNQVKLFGESTGISGIILTKLDGSAKGGIVLAIAHEENIPVKLVGVGECIDDLQVFDSKDFASALFAD